MTTQVIDSFTGEWRFLSNFWPSPVRFLGVTWPTVEHAFQAAKCVDPAARVIIAATATPGHAKRAGRLVRVRPTWDDERVNVMRGLLQLKFALGTNLAQRLVATGDASLVEGNYWHDQLWGDCTCGVLACAGPGLNYLGRLLERTRAELVALGQSSGKR